jgi:thiosulfate/3-mercaptopyruvate sulfurtransferase
MNLTPAARKSRRFFFARPQFPHQHAARRRKLNAARNTHSHMKIPRSILAALLALSVLLFCIALARVLHAAPPYVAHASAPTPAEPWSAAQAVAPADFAHELTSTNSDAKPTIIYVGFRPLYEGAHIPSASFHGAAGKPEGLADLKSFADPLPRSTNLVIYCGCCPLEKCPNIRAAYSALTDMGFTHLRVLILPQDFNTDWISKGYPTVKSTQ